MIIQGHVDVVTEKNDGTEHDFFTEGVRLLREGDWVTADGTTLGADNGIGVAAALALLAAPADASLPPLEVLLTTDEEAGMGGAMGLDGSMLQGRTLLNLDTEEWGEIYIGCAGGGDSRLLLDLPLVEVEEERAGAGGLVFFSLRVAGLLGGHSGMNIGEGRGNAVKLLARALDAAGLVAPVSLASALGGDKRNAIAREASATFGVPAADAPRVLEVLKRAEAEAKEEFGTLETQLRFEVAELAPESAPARVFAPGAASALLTLVLALPHGPIKYSHAVEGLVETSNNVASIKALGEDEVKAIQDKEGESLGLGQGAAPSASPLSTFSPVGLNETHAVLDVTCSTRSSVDPALTAARRAIARLGALAGARVLQESRYPGWAPTPEAPVIKAAAEALKQVTGYEPGLKAIHAGLECGLLREKIPGVQCVSYGPTITGAHSPDEQVQISTVEPFFKATAILLESLAKVRA